MTFHVSIYFLATGDYRQIIHLRCIEPTPDASLSPGRGIKKGLHKAGLSIIVACG